MLLRSPETLADETRRLLGADDQLVSVERAVLTEGTGAGEPVLYVRNPAGISFEVLLDRAMDIGWADAAGSSLAWRAPRGRAASLRYEHDDKGWTRTFGGGLLATCGLATTGPPSARGGHAYPLHGRIGHTPAENVSWRLVGSGADLAIEVRGDVVEAGLGTPTLRLHRVLRASCCEPRLQVHDTVVNESYGDAAHMFRHHLNLGYPLVGDGSVLTTGATPAGMRDSSHEPDLDGMRLTVARGVVDEEVYYGRVGPDAWVTVESSTRWLSVRWSGTTLPFLIVWRDASAGVNVLGVEPATSRDGGRVRSEEEGEIIYLAPGESREYSSEVVFGRVQGGK